MGHFNKPGFLARDGIQKMTDFNQFGQEWQVLQSEPMIFNERRAPQHPEQCTLPTLTTKRRLGEDSALYQMAEKACAGVEEGSKSFCIFDVTAAGTEEAASTYYTAYVGQGLMHSTEVTDLIVLFVVCFCDVIITFCFCS